MNNKPHIWMDDLDTWFTDEDYQNLDDLLKEDMFPLYTHPVSKAKDRFPNYESICLQCGTTIYKPFKDLTDEEIDNISDEIPHYIDTYMGRRMFARAILIKAQEK